MDRVGEFFAEKTPRRLTTLAVFITLVCLFRHLAPLLVFFVTFERSIGYASNQLSTRTKVSQTKSILLVVLVGFLGLIGAAALGAGKAIRGFASAETVVLDKLSALRDQPLYEKIREQIGDEDQLIERAKHYVGDAISIASTVGHFVVYATVGLVLAVVYLLERHEIHAFYTQIPYASVRGTIMRWFGHLADATVVTVQLQIIVALCNALMTLPILLLLGMPHIGALMLLIFVCALVPVVGGIVSGTVLALLAYQAKGFMGVGIFAALTFVQHKIESYYLNPKLTARHVRLPGFLLIFSLIAWEHVLGFVGLFVSFPFLFVAGKIRAEFVAEEKAHETALALKLGSAVPSIATVEVTVTPTA